MKKYPLFPVPSLEVQDVRAGDSPAKNSQKIPPAKAAAVLVPVASVTVAAAPVVLCPEDSPPVFRSLPTSYPIAQCLHCCANTLLVGTRLAVVV